MKVSHDHSAMSFWFLVYKCFNSNVLPEEFVTWAWQIRAAQRKGLMAEGKPLKTMVSHFANTAGFTEKCFLQQTRVFRKCDLVP